MYGKLFDIDDIASDMRQYFEEVETTCGAAWVRQVEREALHPDKAGRGNYSSDLRANGSAQRAGSGSGALSVSVTTLGFAPACACAAGVGRCVILDVFGGTGTTGAVAEQLGRDSILIDLGYQELQERRTNNLQIAMEAYL